MRAHSSRADQNMGHVCLHRLADLNEPLGSTATASPTLEPLAMGSADTAEHRRLVRMSLQTSAAGFATFHSARFQFQNCQVEPLKKWLTALPSRDSRKRFSDEQIADLFSKWEKRITTLDGITCSQDVMALVCAHEEALDQKVVADIEALPIQAVSAEDILALLTYSTELYKDENASPKQSYEVQIYKEFNRVCREYAHAETPSPGLLEEWALFQPFAFHLNAAIQALPRVCTVLFRGGGYRIDSSAYPLGARGSWGGCISASGDRLQAGRFVDQDTYLKAKSGCYFLILSDEARPMYHLSEFPEELEHLHPLWQQLEVCGVLPASVLQMLSLNIDIITLKLAGKRLPLELHLAALEGLAFIYDEFLESYVPPLVKLHPDAQEVFHFDPQVTAFVQRPEARVLLIAARAGTGKTACALRLARDTRKLGRTWLFVSLPSVDHPFATDGLIQHLAKTFGFQGQEVAELQRRPLVLILDSLDEVPVQVLTRPLPLSPSPPPSPPALWSEVQSHTGGRGYTSWNFCISNSVRNFCTQLVRCF